MAKKKEKEKENLESEIHNLAKRVSKLEKEAFGSADPVKFDPVTEYQAFFGDKFVGDEILRIAGQLRYAGSQSATTELLEKLAHDLYLCGNRLKAEQYV